MPTPTAPPARLDRTLSASSAEHVRFSLKRLATHETGAQDALGTHRETETAVGDEENEIKRGEDSADSAAESTTDKAEFQLQDQTNLLPFKQLVMVFVGLSAALFCSLLDQTMFVLRAQHTLIPSIASQPHCRRWARSSTGQISLAGCTSCLWFPLTSASGTSYLLTSTACQPLYGRLSDIFGRKAMLLFALGIFFVGSIACAVAQTLIQLIVFRAIQGMGGGGIITLAMIISAYSTCTARASLTNKS
jgi:hypothetical protein